MCCCVSFFIVAGNSSQNENMFLQKNLIGFICKYHNWCSCQNTNTNYDPKKLRPEKKVQSFGRLCFLNHRKKITNQKKRYSHLTDGWNKSQINICCFKIWTHQLRLEKIMTGNKMYDTVVWSSVMSKYKHHQSHFNLRKFLLCFFISQKQWDPNFLLLWSLSCFVWIYNHTVTIVSQKYQELCLISETILIRFLYFRKTTC